MKPKPTRRQKWILLALALLLLTLAIGYFTPASEAQASLQQTRALLKQHGFKIDLSEFDFSTPLEQRLRLAPLTNHFPGTLTSTDLLPFISSNAALLIWKVDNWIPFPQATSHRAPHPQLFWNEARAFIQPHRDHLQNATAAALSGPIRFHLDATQGAGLLLPHLAAIKFHAQLFALATLLELHQRNNEAAWTNLLAATRLVTAWTPEPTFISPLVRFASLHTAFKITWQALPAGWSDQQLLQLQREWENTHLFHQLPEAIAYNRASLAALVQSFRQQNLSFGLSPPQLIRHPLLAWQEFLAYHQQRTYRAHGSFEDEKELLLAYRDREIHFRDALQASTWLEMRHSPAATNLTTFTSKYNSPLQTIINIRELNLNIQLQHQRSASEPQTILHKAAEAEALRRLLITAIALERYRLRHSSYPDHLQKLTPELLSSLPLDFIDRQPLRYRLHENTFLLYSLGLDALDNGGSSSSFTPGASYSRSAPPSSADLLWPKIASPEETAAHNRQQLEQFRSTFNSRLAQESDNHWSTTAHRQAAVAQLPSPPFSPPSPEPTLAGRPLAQLLAIPNHPTPPTFAELFTPKPLLTGNEPELVTFELPNNFEALTNTGTLLLLVDPHPEGDLLYESSAVAFDLIPATNRATLLRWNTTFEAPGPHLLQLLLLPHRFQPISSEEALTGPPFHFNLTNVAQFTPSSSLTHPLLGQTLRAKLIEPHASYSVSFTSETGQILKQFSGFTSNGIIDLHWDLQTTNGTLWTNLASPRFHITFPSSTKSHSFNGPLTSFPSN